MAGGAAVEFDAKDAIDGLAEIKEHSIPESIKAALIEAAEMAILTAKSLVPVDTGELHASIEILEESDDYIILGSLLEYASYVEWGTSKMEAQPYLSPAYDEIHAQFTELFISQLETRLPSS